MARVTQYQIPAVTLKPRTMLNYSRLPWPTHVLGPCPPPRTGSPGSLTQVFLDVSSWAKAGGGDGVLGDSEVAVGEWELGSLGVLTFSAGLCSRALMQPLWEGGSQPPAHPDPSPGATLRSAEYLTTMIVVPSHLHTMLEKAVLNDAKRSLHFQCSVSLGKPKEYWKVHVHSCVISLEFFCWEMLEVFSADLPQLSHFALAGVLSPPCPLNRATSLLT